VWFKFLVKQEKVAITDKRFTQPIQDQLIDFVLDQDKGEQVLEYILTRLPSVRLHLDANYGNVHKEEVKLPNAKKPIVTVEELQQDMKTRITWEPTGHGNGLIKYGDCFQYHDKGYFCADEYQMNLVWQGRNELKTIAQGNYPETRDLCVFTKRCQVLYHTVLYGGKPIPYRENPEIYKTPDTGLCLVPCAAMGTVLHPFYRLVRKLHEAGENTWYETAGGPHFVKTSVVVGLNRLFNVNKTYPFVGRSWNDLVCLFELLLNKFTYQGYWFTSWISFCDSVSGKNVIFLAF